MKAGNLLVYRDKLLGTSETFILAQGEGLSRYRAFYFGARRIAGTDLPAARSYCINNGGRLGRCGEILFKAFGWIRHSEREMIRKLHPVLLHAHFGPDGVLALPLARSFGLPLIVTFHGYDATTKDAYARKSDYTHRKFLKKRKALFAECSQFIAVSEFIRGKLLEQGAPKQKILVHYVGVDLAKFQPLPQIERTPIVLFVGRLVEVKGCRHLLRAMQDVQRSFPAAELVVIGDGPLRLQLEEQARQSLQYCQFLGSQPPHVVREWMNRAKVFSVPSITAENGNAEGFGIVFAEAQAMGLPVVSFSSGGIPEAVAHGETGFLSPEGDWEGLARNILRLLADQDLWLRMSRQGQERARDRFDLERQTRLLEDIYDKVISVSMTVEENR
jgi:colanic acid/amylovoran biosynthesis glycosyltransferase